MPQPNNIIYDRTLLPDQELNLAIWATSCTSGMRASVARDDTYFPGDPMSHLIAIPGFPVVIRIEANDRGARITMERETKDAAA